MISVLRGWFSACVKRLSSLVAGRPFAVKKTPDLLLRQGVPALVDHLRCDLQNGRIVVGQILLGLEVLVDVFDRAQVALAI